MSDIVKIDVNNLSESYEFNKVARQADGAVLYRQGKAVLLAAVVIDKESSTEDFLPLTVQYIEKSYAAAKIPGGFVKRESKPGDFETLTARIVDRALRPLFPKDFANGVVITIMVLSSDENVDFQIAALHAANAALIVSNLPTQKSIAGVRVAKIDGEIVINPKLKDLNRSTLDLLVVGSGKDIAMIEMRVQSTKNEDEFRVNEIDNKELVSIIESVIPKIDEASKRYFEGFIPYKSKNIIEVSYKEIPKELIDFISSYYNDEINRAIAAMSKSERMDELENILIEIKYEIEAKGLGYEEDIVKLAFNQIIKNKVRALLLEGKRLDGRAFDEVRPIWIETNLLPSVHGSTLFTRGETQALVTGTLGDKKDAQMYELLTSNIAQNENFMVHYNFPPFCVGEAKPIGAPSRRELGHGNLAKRALEPTLNLDSNQTIRLVSEILESNGSSSMATVCGGSLTLYCMNVDVKKLCAGVAMGVIVKDNSNYAILTDIVGAEDHYGDMDFKVAGTKDGLTALQLDIKLDGLNINILDEALTQARKALDYILDIMEEARKNIVPSAALPTTMEFKVTQGDIPVIIGKGGSTIKSIIERFGVSIDIDRDKGVVKLSGESIEKLKETKEHIIELIKNFIR
ncbi:MAG: polyribonucleotide nucleotidyltransferase [Epsilonproteobacteria bacterium]|nr:polyribonucleotide nucleotidyltransferase [Campylobacterota bacterium]